MKQLQLLFLALILCAQMTSQTGAALHFDGSNDYVQCGNILPASYTKEAWINITSHTGSSNVVSGGGGIGQHAFWVPSGTLSAGHNGGWSQVQDPTPLVTNTWYHIAVTYDAATTTLKLYKNGTLVSTNTSVLPYSNGNGVLIGSYDNGNLFNGSIDEVRVWSVVRTACEINAYMNCEIPTAAPGLVANYHFNQGIDGGTNPTETSLTDASGNANTGTLTNVDLTGTNSNWVTPGGVVSGYTTTGAAQLTVTATSSVICNGESTTLNASGALTYTWTGGVTNGIAFNPTITTTYTVTGTDAGGCATSPTTQVVTVNTPSVTTTDGVICSGNSYTITPGGASTYTITGGSFVVSPTVLTTYSITGTDANGCVSINTAVCEVNVNDLPTVTASTTNSVICNGASTTLNGGGADTYSWTSGVTDNTVFSPTTTLTYTVTGTDVNGCENTATQIVTVNNLPTVTASATNSAICQGASTTLHGGGASTYTWTGGVTNGATFTPTVTDTYTVTGTSAAGCASTNTATQVITVNDLPTVTASVTNSVICNGASTTLNGGGASTYTWTGSVTDNTAFSPTATLTYTVTGTDGNGCKNTATQVVTVNNLPTVTASATNSVICNGASTTLNGGGAITYTWTGGVTDNTVFSPTTTLTYTVTGTDGNGCKNTATKTVTVNNLPTVTASATNSVICQGASATLHGGGASTYTWTGGVTDNTAFSPTTTLTYTVTGTSAAGCTSTNTATQVITVNDLPTVTASATNSVICNGASTTLNGGGASTYTWTGGVTDNTAFSPTTTLTYTVTGTDGNGCKNKATQIVTVNNLPTVTASATNSVICNGASTTLNGGGASTYTWTGGVTDNTSFSPTATLTYTVTGTDGNGCKNTATKTVTVNNLPTVTASATNSVICQGASATLHGGGASTYTWTGGVTDNTAFSPTTTLTYTVTGTSAAGCTSTNTATQVITVNDLPTVTASATNSMICNGASTTLNGGGASTYTWTGGVTDNTAFSPTTTLTYTVTGTDGNGCKNTATQIVTVNNLPTITASATNSVICNGASTTLNGGGASTYTWTGGITDNTAFSPTTTLTYTVTGTSAAGCTSTNTATQVVTVNDLPNISVISASICAGSTGTVSASGADTYTWSTGSNSAAITDNPTTTAVYTVSGTSAAGCLGASVTATITVGSAPAIVVNSESVCAGSTVTLTASGVTTYTWSTGANSSSIVVSPTTNTVYVVSGDLVGCTVGASNTSTVNINALPTVTVNSGAICSGTSFTIVPGGAVTYTYSSGSSIVTPSGDNSYTVTGTDGNGCKNSAVSTVTVHTLPTITATSTSTLLCTGETATLSVTGGVTSYTWSTTETTAGIAVTPTAQATYTVQGTDANGCSNATTITQDVSICTGIAAISNTDVSIHVYPNPNNGLFMIELTATSKVTVTNALGQVVISEIFEAGKHQVDIHNETTGVYFVKVIENNKQHMIKIIKQ